MTHLVRLSAGHGAAIVDDVDRDLVESMSWHLHCGGYAVGNRGRKFSPRMVLMHRLVMSPDSGLVVDHVNRNKLDNRRENLRVTTQVHNLANCVRTWSTTGIRGVHERHGHPGQWIAHICVAGVRRTARFDSPLLAAERRKEWERELLGEFAPVTA